MKLVLALVLLIALPVQADVIDKLKSESKVNRCIEVARLYGDGMMIYNEGAESVKTRIADIEFQSDRDKNFYTAVAGAGFKFLQKWLKDEHAKKVADAEPEWKDKIVFTNTVPQQHIVHFFYNIRQGCISAQGNGIVEKLPFMSYEALKMFGLKAGFIKTQSEHLEDEIDYQNMELRVMGCQANLPLYFQSCITVGVYSEAQMIAAIKRCNIESWHKFFDCTKLYPSPTMQQQLDCEI